MTILHDIKQDLHKYLPIRQPASHKGDYGRILLLCGSKGYTGAAYFAAMGALRSGAGVVYLAVPESIYEIEAVKLSEPVIMPLPDKEGKMSRNAIAVIKDLLPKMDAVLIGPGIGMSEDVSEVVKYLVENYNGPLVIDADGINCLSEHTHILRDRIYPTILTPHDGEFVRIGGVILQDRPAAAAELAKQTGSIVLLKGNNTVVTDGARCYQNTTGNPGMATGGSGDVLAGIIVSLLGQGVPPLEAAACGAYLHGAAGDICAEKIGQYGMLPQDMLSVLPRLLP